MVATILNDIIYFGILQSLMILICKHFPCVDDTGREFQAVDGLDAGMHACRASSLSRPKANHQHVIRLIHKQDGDMSKQFHITCRDQVGGGHRNAVGDQPFCSGIKNTIVVLENGYSIGEPFLEIQQLFKVAFSGAVSHEERI